ncbi:MAG: site-specific DNA-methyltransferase [Myxococcales bacterium]|nr:site-specific DNA-methyltransferase [Myxococcales bacterium]
MSEPRRRAQRGVLLAGDCLALVPTLVTRPSDQFDLIYVDPPFNTGVAHKARNQRGARVAGNTAYSDAWGGLDAFLGMLEPRLAAFREVLALTGSLWLHLDHRGVHDAKVLADRVFGRPAFRGEIVWVPGNGARGRRGPSVTHQTILVYARGKDMRWNASDPLLREPFAKTSLSMHFSNLDADGRAFRERTLGGKTYRYYADEGRRLGSVWSDCPAMRANTPLDPEATGYPTQKPERLLERIVRATTDEESRVLDPMCGSGTTLAVAERLGRRWVGVDQSPIAIKVASARLGL